MDKLFEGIGKMLIALVVFIPLSFLSAKVTQDLWSWLIVTTYEGATPISWSLAWGANLFLTWMAAKLAPNKDSESDLFERFIYGLFYILLVWGTSFIFYLVWFSRL